MSSHDAGPTSLRKVLYFLVLDLPHLVPLFLLRVTAVHPLTAVLHPSRFFAIKYVWNDLVTLLHEIFTGETSPVTASRSIFALWNPRDLSHALIPMNCSQ
jgi:hypothetical protein